MGTIRKPVDPKRAQCWCVLEMAAEVLEKRGIVLIASALRDQARACEKRNDCECRGENAKKRTGDR